MPSTRRLCRRSTATSSTVAGSTGVAEDLTQETFLASITELRKGRRPAAPIPWIYGIARHKLLDHYRRQERAELPVDPQLELAEQPPEALDLGDREDAMVALAAVPAAQRAALVLHYVDGFSVREVAGYLDRTEKAAEGLLGRGREAFKRAYLEASA